MDLQGLTGFDLIESAARLGGDTKSEGEGIVELDALDAEFVEGVGLFEGIGFGVAGEADEVVVYFEGVGEGWGDGFGVGGVEALCCVGDCAGESRNHLGGEGVVFLQTQDGGVDAGEEGGGGAGRGRHTVGAKAGV
jgi:hypothetical protein